MAIINLKISGIKDEDIASQLAQIIRYHKDGLAQYRLQMSPSAQALEQMTVEVLEQIERED